MNAAYGRMGRYGQSQEAGQASKLVTCRPGANPGQIICTPQRAGPVPVDPETGMPMRQAPLPIYDAVQYAGYGGRRSRYGYWGRFGVAVSSAPASSVSTKSVSSTPVITGSTTITNPSYSTTITNPSTSSYSTSSAVASSVPSISASYMASAVVPSSSSASAVLPSTSTAGTVVQATGSGDAPYFNPSSSSMWNPGGWGPMSAEGQVQMREGEDSPGGYDDEDEDERQDDRDDEGFPGERNRKRRPGRGYPASKRRRRRRARRSYSAWGAYHALYGAGEIIGQGKLAGRSYFKKQGSGGYVYLQFTDDGGITVDPASPDRKGKYLAPRSSAVWYAITKEIGPLAKDKAAVASYYKAKANQNALAKASQVPTSVVVTGQNNKSLNALFAALGAGSSADGKKLVAQAAVAHGPDVAEAASEFLAERKSSPAAIQKKIDKLKVKLAAAKAKHDTVKVRKLQAKIKGLQARLLAAQAAVSDLDVTGSTTVAAPGFPWKYAVGGLVGLVLIGVLAKAMMR